MSKPVILTVERWRAIREDLHNYYPPSIFMRDNMKRKLGFTVREHKAWIPKLDGGYSELQIHLDFYDEKKKTFFLIKYGS
jgi:hypothetical protein